MSESKKTILITGCSSGFGKLATIALCTHHNVIATMRDLSKKDQFDNVEDRSNIDIQYCDVLDQHSITQLASHLKSTYKKVDVLINNAGVFLGGFFEDCTAAEIDTVINTNITGVFNVTKAILPLLRESKHGKLINISSSSGLVAMPAASIYAASKHAIEGWSEALFYELAPFGISVSCVEPQTYDTAMLRKNLKLTIGKDNSASVYFHFYKPLLEKIFSRKKVGRDPVEVVAVLEKIVNSKKPKLRYLVGPSTQIKFHLKYLLPFEFFYKLVNMIFSKILNKKTIKHVAA